QAPIDILIAVERRQNQDARVRKLRAQDRERLETVHLRHLQIHQGHVGTLLAEERDGFGARAGLADDLHIRETFQESGKAFSDGRMILGDQETDGRRASHVFLLTGTGEESGKIASTTVPCPSALERRRRPPCRWARSRIPLSPKPPCAEALSGAKPHPSSVI